MFQTNYKHNEFPAVEVSDELITEQTGYRSTKEIVEGMVLAGQRLSDYRHGMLDNFDEEYDESQEPAYPYEVDPVDIQDAVERRQVRYRTQKEEVSDDNETGRTEESGVRDTPEKSDSGSEEAREKEA